ncbi:MAG: hypothetical protein ACREJQ_04030, partial [bacterium]
LMLALAVGVLARWMERATGHGGAWSDVHRLAAAAGPLAFFILLAPLREFLLPHPDNPAGQTLLGLARRRRSVLAVSRRESPRSESDSNCHAQRGPVRCDCRSHLKRKVSRLHSQAVQQLELLQSIGESGGVHNFPELAQCGNLLR